MYQLPVGQVVRAPLRPDQVVEDPFYRLPILEPDTENLPYTGFGLQRHGKLGYGLDDVHLLGRRPSVTLPILRG
jgi:hypothetical protein